MKASDNPFVAAIRFLTVFPVPGRIGSSEKALLGAVPYFPVVGLLLGLVAYGLVFAVWSCLNPLLASVIIVVILMAFSGGLHLDGLADTADGFFSSRPRERILEIMRDSRIGVMGVIWIVALFLLKVAALSDMTMEQASKAVFLMPLAGRTMMIVLMALLPYVRKDQGLASLFYGKARGWCVWWALCLLFGAGFLVAGYLAVFASFLAVLFTLLFAWFCRAKIGGATGDTLGASCELAETGIAIAMAVKILEL